MTWTILLALALIGMAGLYIFLRRRRSPKAYKAMIAVFGRVLCFRLDPERLGLPT
jgi:LPXTG-motif cell wall-anchored protein